MVRQEFHRPCWIEHSIRVALWKSFSSAWEEDEHPVHGWACRVFACRADAVSIQRSSALLESNQQRHQKEVRRPVQSRLLRRRLSTWLAAVNSGGEDERSRDKDAERAEDFHRRRVFQDSPRLERRTTRFFKAMERKAWKFEWIVWRRLKNGLSE